jgi:predicted patatin/cPLA2 family phospholipase
MAAGNGTGRRVDTTASPDHPVIREIVRRRVEGAVGNSPAAVSAGVKLGLVVEGGGMRGVYSGGALVGMEELGLSKTFDAVYGESAGAINACYFLAGQGGFGIRIYVDDLTSLKFANPLRLGTMLDVRYAIDVVVKTIKPLQVEKVLASPSDLFMAVTSGVTGESRVVDAKREGIPLLTLLLATGAIVPLYNHAVMIAGHPYVDGGIANPIPIASAIAGGCTHILVLLTRPPEFRSKSYNCLQRFCLSPLFRKWPAAFVDAFYQRQATRYNETRDVAFGRTATKPDIHIAVISPAPDSPPLGRSTVSRKRLLAAKDDAVLRTRSVFRELAMT